MTFLYVLKRVPMITYCVLWAWTTYVGYIPALMSKRRIAIMMATMAAIIPQT